MKTLSAMHVRRHFGAVLDEVRIKSETIVLERAGKPIALITPLKETTDTNVNSGPLIALRNLKGRGTTKRGEHPDQWVNNEREERNHENLH